MSRSPASTSDVVMVGLVGDISKGEEHVHHADKDFKNSAYIVEGSA